MVASYFLSRFPVQQLLFSTQGHYQPFLNHSSAEETAHKVIERTTSSLLKVQTKSLMAGASVVPLVVLHLYTEATLSIALILKADEVWEAMDFGEKILLTKGLCLTPKDINRTIAKWGTGAENCSLHGFNCWPTPVCMGIRYCGEKLLISFNSRHDFIS